jgi:enterochelin esterase-like enzyme
LEVEKGSVILVENELIKSVNLNREVKIDFYIPQSLEPGAPVSLLLINDGQDLDKMDFTSILSSFSSSGPVSSLLCVGIHCGADRKMEYGVAGIPDFKGRGAKAHLYTAFILEELLPFVYFRTGAVFKDHAFAGFSLGGLMALDIVWNYADLFSTAAVFSGSLWWRNIDQTDDDYNDDQHRIMHQQVRNGSFHPGLKFFFQCGNMDETRDRNQNGIIDSIDDTRDLIRELIVKGYDDKKDIHYLEIPDGRHDVPTWGKGMVEFLKWRYGSDK